MNIVKEINGNSAVIKPEGWLDTPSAAEFKTVIESLGSEITEITMDLKDLEFISSAGLRVIVAAHKKVNGNLTVINTSPEIADVFRMTGFDKRLNIK